MGVYSVVRFFDFLNISFFVLPIITVVAGKKHLKRGVRVKLLLLFVKYISKPIRTRWFSE